MKEFNFEEIVKIARKGNNSDWDEVKSYLSGYNGASDDILGVKLFLQNNQQLDSRMAFVSFISDVESAKPNELRKPSLIKIPSWTMVAAASILLVAGLIANHYVHRLSIHMIDEPLPIYLSNQNLTLNKGMAQYKKGDYNSAAVTLSKLTSDTGLYYTAICYELTGNYPASLLKLKQVPNHSVFYTKSLIRLAAVYIELNNTSEAKSILNNLKPEDEIDAQRIKSIKVRLK
jgi:hypothetical protein